MCAGKSKGVENIGGHVRVRSMLRHVHYAIFWCMLQVTQSSTQNLGGTFITCCKTFHEIDKYSSSLLALLLLLQIFWRGEVVTDSIIFQLQFVYKAKTSVLTCLHNQFISSNPNIVTYITWFICDTKIIEC